ncbi:hypothetical protein [Helicobacter aurati]
MAKKGNLHAGFNHLQATKGVELLINNFSLERCQISIWNVQQGMRMKIDKVKTAFKISPEAAEGGLIALIEDGDRIAISVSKGTLDLLVDSAVLEARRAKWKPIKKEIKSKWLKRYSLLVSNAANGAVLKTEL